MKISDINNKYFWLHNIPDLSVSSENAEENIVISVNGNVIFDEVLYADESKNIELLDMADLLVPYISAGCNTVCFVGLDVEFYVFFCNKRIYGISDIPANKCFVLSASTESMCRFDDIVKMYLLQLDCSVQTLSCRTVFVDQNGDSFCIDSEIDLDNVGDIIELNISQADLIRPYIELGCKAMGLLFYNGNELIHQVIFDDGIGISYSNNFGLIENVVLPGVLKESPAYDRTMGYFHGRNNVIDTDVKIKYSFECAPCSRQIALKLADMMESRNCKIKIFDKVIDVVPDECDIEYASDKQELLLPKVSFIRAESTNEI